MPNEARYKLIKALSENKVLNKISDTISYLIDTQLVSFFLDYYNYILIIILIIVAFAISQEMKKGTIKLSDYINEAISSILQNKMKSLFSILGLSIGIASAITVISIGQSSGALAVENLIEIQNKILNKKVSYIFQISPNPMGNNKVRSTKPANLGIDDIISLKEKCPYIKTIYPCMYKENVISEFNDKKFQTGILETSEGYKLEYPLEGGRFFNKAEVEQKEKVCLITGDDLKKELFGNMDPINKYMKVDKIVFRVIGIINPVELKNRIILPITAFPQDEFPKLNSIMIITTTGCNADYVKNKIKQIIQLKSNKRPFIVSGITDFIIEKTIEETQKKQISMAPIQAIMGLIAAISLLIGGIGIMNIMLVTVANRSMEIGVRRAMGARKSDILSQFLLEALILSFIAGIIGLIGGIGGAFSLTCILQKFGHHISLSFSLKNNLFISILFSIGTGLLFGEYPARKAAELDPIDCLRHSG